MILNEKQIFNFLSTLVKIVEEKEKVTIKYEIKKRTQPPSKGSLA